MKTHKTLWLALAAVAVAFAVPQAAKADHRRMNKIERLTYQLLTARDDDDREDAAEDLGKIGGPHTLKALDYAAENDDDRGVRKEARKAAKRIRARILARRLSRERHETVLIHQEVVRPSRCRPNIVTLPTRRKEVVIVRQPPRVTRHRPNFWRHGRDRGRRDRHDDRLSIGFSLNF